MMRFVPLVLLLSVGACTTPNVSEEITAAQTLFRVTDEQARAELEQRAAQERREAEDDLIASQQIAIQLADCFASNSFDLSPNCRLVSAFDNIEGPPGEPTASEVLVLFYALDGYFAALAAIATEGDADKVTTAARAVAQSIAEVETGGLERLAPLADYFEDYGDGLSEAAGFLAQQYQTAALRRTVIQADPVLSEALENAAQYYLNDGELEAARTRLQDAALRANIAQAEGNISVARDAINELKTAHEAFLNIQNESPAYSFYLIGEMHEQLKDKLTSINSSQEILQTLQRIETVISAFEE